MRSAARYAPRLDAPAPDPNKGAYANYLAHGHAREGASGRIEMARVSGGWSEALDTNALRCDTGCACSTCTTSQGTPAAAAANEGTGSCPNPRPTPAPRH